MLQVGATGIEGGGGGGGEIHKGKIVLLTETVLKEWRVKK
jgi:hypothetical protein